MEYIDRLLSVWCEEYEAAKGLRYLPIKGKDSSALARLAAHYRKHNPGSSTEQAVADFRLLFRAALNINDPWLKRNMTPAILSSKINEIRSIINDRPYSLQPEQLTGLAAKHWG